MSKHVYIAFICAFAWILKTGKREACCPWRSASEEYLFTSDKLDKDDTRFGRSKKREKEKRRSKIISKIATSSVQRISDTMIQWFNFIIDQRAFECGQSMSVIDQGKPKSFLFTGCVCMCVYIVYKMQKTRREIDFAAFICEYFLRLFPLKLEWLAFSRRFFLVYGIRRERSLDFPYYIIRHRSRMKICSTGSSLKINSKLESEYIIPTFYLYCARTERNVCFQRSLSLSLFLSLSLSSSFPIILDYS